MTTCQVSQCVGPAGPQVILRLLRIIFFPSTSRKGYGVEQLCHGESTRVEVAHGVGHRLGSAQRPRPREGGRLLLWDREKRLCLVARPQSSSGKSPCSSVLRPAMSPFENLAPSQKRMTNLRTQVIQFPFNKMRDPACINLKDAALQPFKAADGFAISIEDDKESFTVVPRLSCPSDSVVSFRYVSDPRWAGPAARCSGGKDQQGNCDSCSLTRRILTSQPLIKTIPIPHQDVRDLS